MQAHPCSVVFIALTLGSAVAGTSANYTTSPQAIDAGGQRAARSNYTADGSLGGVAGISAVIPPDAIAKQGYLAAPCLATMDDTSRWPGLSGASAIDNGNTRSNDHDNESIRPTHPSHAKPQLPPPPPNGLWPQHHENKNTIHSYSGHWVHGRQPSCGGNEILGTL